MQLEWLRRQNGGGRRGLDRASDEGKREGGIFSEGEHSTCAHPTRLE